MDLPREIRNYIYKAALSPLCTVKDFDGVTLSIMGPCKKPHWPPDYPGLPDGPESAEQQAVRRSFKPTHYTLRDAHPGRQYNYDIYPSFPSEDSSKDEKDSWDEPADEIRSLSNTNSIIRKELAEVLWSRTSICLDAAASISRLEMLLIDRPAICAGIKALSFELDFGPCSNPLHKRFLQICRRIGGLLQLESLEVEIVLLEPDIESFFQIDKKPVWAEGIRALTVTRSFKLTLNAFPDDSSDEEWQNEKDRLVGQYERLMEDEIRPDSLRPKEKPLDKMTDVERYMATRL